MKTISTLLAIKFEWCLASEEGFSVCHAADVESLP